MQAAASNRSIQSFPNHTLVSMEMGTIPRPGSLWQKRGIWLLLLTLSASITLTNAEGNDAAGTFEKFISNLIGTFQLTSPTLIYHEEAPEICFTSTWILCLEDNLELQPSELAYPGQFVYRCHLLGSVISPKYKFKTLTPFNFLTLWQKLK